MPVGAVRGEPLKGVIANNIVVLPIQVPRKEGNRYFSFPISVNTNIDVLPIHPSVESG